MAHDVVKPALAAPAARLRTAPPRTTRQARWGYLFAAAPLLLFAVFVLLPFGLALLVSFTDYAVVGDAHWVGLENYRRFVDDPFFWTAFRNTVQYTALYVPLGLVVALAPV